MHQRCIRYYLPLTNFVIFRELTTISELQNVLVKQGALDNGMLLLVRLNDENVREGLAFLCCILFNANDTVQVSKHSRVIHLVSHIDFVYN